MAFIDKYGLLSKLNTIEKVVLDVGCGPHKKQKDWIGIDVLNYEGVDIVGDIIEVLESIPNESIDEIHAYHFFEHVSDIPLLLKRISEVIKKEGKIFIVVPHFSNPYFYSDYTHKTFFGLYSFSYLTLDRIFKRKVPNYSVETGLKLQKVDLIFESPFPTKRRVKKMYQKVFNISTSMKEFYEESLCYSFPCYELRFVLEKLNCE